MIGLAIMVYYTLNVRSRDEIEGNIKTRGKTKLTGFPRDLTLSVFGYETIIANSALRALLATYFHIQRAHVE